MSWVVSSACLGAAVVTAHLLANLRALRTPRTVGSVEQAPVQGAAPTNRRPAARPDLSVLVPARDEAERIRACLDAVLASAGVELEVLVLDDESTDGTADVTVAAAAGDPRLRLLPGSPPPVGWLGKPHACQQLADAARGRVLAFVDADVRVAASGLAAAVALLDSTPLDLISPYPRQIAEGPAARLVQPLLQWSWLAFLPLRLAERAPQPALTAANGQLLVCGAAAYRAVGGHARVRDAVVEDVALARAFKRAGYRATVVDGTDVASCRMYAGWGQLRDGYTKSLWAAFGPPTGAVAAIALLGWLYLLPPVAALRALARGRIRQALVPAAGYAAAVVGRVAAARRTGGRSADAPAHPVSIGLLAWLTALSWWRRSRGDLRWRGRLVPGRGRG